MIRKNVRDLQGNEILAKPIMNLRYQVILPQGVQLKKNHIMHLEELGIVEVYVKEESLPQDEISILKSDIEKSVKKQVKSILEQHVYQNNKELFALSKAVDDILSNILEEKDVLQKIYDIREKNTDIYGHSISTCTLSILTALKMNVEQETIHDIGVGCLLHDLGLRYLSIAFEKQDVRNLNDSEMQEYRKHPIYGYQAVEKERWVSDLSKQIILYHHEKSDGSGFPLHAKEIPFACQIVSVCNMFDEIFSGLFYKNVKIYEAVEYLKNASGKWYDKKIVETFLSFIAVYPVGTYVFTSEGETAVVISQNEGFQDRPVLKILRDKNGRQVEGEVIKNMITFPSLFIEKVLDQA